MADLLTQPYVYVLGLLLVMSCAAFTLMGVDKKKARMHQYRIPEKTLFVVALLGGGVGAVLGMQVFRHKTKHWYFVVGMPAIMIVQLAGLVWLIAR